MYHLPKSNVDFWQKKIANNRARDVKNLDLYRQMGWTALVVWECELRRKSDAEATIARLLNTLHYLTGRGEAVALGESVAIEDVDFDSQDNYRIAAEPETPFGVGE
jgi:DNA mismatch endonuclease (patch repair protein)